MAYSSPTAPLQESEFMDSSVCHNVYWMNKRRNLPALQPLPHSSILWARFPDVSLSPGCMSIAGRDFSCNLLYVVVVFSELLSGYARKDFNTLGAIG